MSGSKRLTKEELARGLESSARYRRRGAVSAKPLSSDLNWSSGHGDDLHSRQGDWLVTDETETWVVSAKIFEKRYVLGKDGRFRGKATVRAFRLCEDTQVMTLEGVVSGTPGDWVLVGEDDDAWVVSADRFAATYTRLDNAP